MIELSRDEMYNIRRLCMSRAEDVVLWSCVEGNMGRAWVNNKNDPTEAIIVAADFCFLLGEVENTNDDIVTRVLSEHCRGKIIVADAESWTLFIEKNYSNSFRRFKRFAFKKEHSIFDKKQLKDFALSVEPEFQVVKIDETLYYKALEDNFTADFCCFFSSLDEFLGHGIGYVIVHNNEIIAGASSYIYCKDRIEITVGTKNEYRQRGLALACASKLILDCMDKGIYPNWEAANLESMALAKKLGYEFDKEFIVYSI